MEAEKYLHTVLDEVEKISNEIEHEKNVGEAEIQAVATNKEKAVLSKALLSRLDKLKEKRSSLLQSEEVDNALKTICETSKNPKLKDIYKKIREYTTAPSAAMER